MILSHGSRECAQRQPQCGETQGEENGPTCEQRQVTQTPKSSEVSHNSVLRQHTRLDSRLLPELNLSLICEGEVIVQGDESPVRGVAQVVGCHGVTVGHQEREEEEEQQEVEGEGEKTLKERCACPWMG